MFKSIIVALLALSLPFAAQAATSHSNQQMPKFLQELNLTSKQNDQFKQLMTTQFQHNQQIVESYLNKLPEAQKKSLQTQLSSAPMPKKFLLTKEYLGKLPAADQAAFQKEMIATNTKNQQELRAILTPAQQKTFDAQRKAFEEKLNKAHANK